MVQLVTAPEAMPIERPSEPGEQRLPAFARGLIARRRMGNGPLIVDLIFGANWAAPADASPCLLAINPHQYAPGRFDLRCVAGLYVHLRVRDYRLHAGGPWRSWEFLAGELALQTGYVWIHEPSMPKLGGVAFELASTLAYAHRLHDGTWPQWWPHRDAH